MEQEHKSYEKYSGTQGLGKWYSWDSPIGLSLGFAISLSSVGLFIFLLHQAGIF